MGASISYLRHRLSTTTIPPFNDDRWIRRAGQILQWVAGQNNEFRQLARLDRAVVLGCERMFSRVAS